MYSKRPEYTGECHSCLNIKMAVTINQKLNLVLTIMNKDKKMLRAFYLHALNRNLNVFIG